MTLSEVEKLIKDNINAPAEINIILLVIQIMKESIYEAFSVGFDTRSEEKEGIKTPIINMEEGALVEIVDHNRLHIILVRIMNNYSKSTRILDSLTRRALGSTFIREAIVKFVMNQD